MIILLAGTRDGREIARQLNEDGHPVLVTTVSDYGGQLAAESGAEVHIKALSADDLRDLAHARKARMIIDCTHPYAAQASITAQQVADDEGLTYIRFERAAVIMQEHDTVYLVESWEDAAERAAELGNTIFLTTGSRNLEVFLKQPAVNGKRVIARVLPEPEVISLCRRLGMIPRDIIAMQGPFSHELNVAMFRDSGAQVIITKDAGQTGGTDTKLTAARTLDIPVVVIGKPKISYQHVVSDYENLKRKIMEVYQI